MIFALTTNAMLIIIMYLFIVISVFIGVYCGLYFIEVDCIHSICISTVFIGTVFIYIYSYLLGWI